VELSRGTGDTDEYIQSHLQAVNWQLAGLSNWATDREIALKARLPPGILVPGSPRAPTMRATRILCGPTRARIRPTPRAWWANLYYILHDLQSAAAAGPCSATRTGAKARRTPIWIPSSPRCLTTFPLPRPIADRMSYPCRVLVSTKAGDWATIPTMTTRRNLCAGGRSDLTSYLAEDYCLGKLQPLLFYAGQNETASLCYREAARWRNRRTRKFLIFRYLINTAIHSDSVARWMATV